MSCANQKYNKLTDLLEFMKYFEALERCELFEWLLVSTAVNHR